MLAVMAALAAVPVTNGADGGAVSFAGSWAARVSGPLSTCTQNVGAWGWEISGHVARLGEDLKVIQEWDVGDEIISLYVSKGCSSAWVRTRNGNVLHLRAGRPEASELPLAKRFTLQDIDWALIRGDGLFISLRAPRIGAVLTEGSSGLDRRDLVLPNGGVDDDVDLAVNGAAWVVPETMNGVFTFLPDGGVKRSLEKVSMKNVYASANAEVALGVPAAVEGDPGLGIYAIDLDGNPLLHGAPLLDKCAVTGVWTGVFLPVVWVDCENGDVFAIRFERRGRLWGMKVLNHGNPVYDSKTGSPLLVESVVVASDTTAWGMGNSSNSPTKFFDDYGLLSILPDDTVQFDHAPREEARDIRQLMSATTRPRSCWLKHTSGVTEVEFSTDGQVVTRPVPVGRLNVGWIKPRQDGGYWIQATPDSFATVPAGAGSEVTVELEGVTLSSGSPPTRAIPSSSSDLGNANIILRPPPQLAGHPMEPPSIRMAILDADGNVLARGEAASIDGGTQIALVPVAGTPSDGHFEVQVQVENEQATNLKVSWKGVAFTPPLWKQITKAPLVRLLGWLILPIMALATVFRTTRLKTWAPVLVPLVEATVKSQRPEAITALSMQDFLAAVLVLFAVTLGACCISPPMLRVLADLQPFQWILPVCLRIPFVRHRAFRPYLESLQQRLRKLRQLEGPAADDWFFDQTVDEIGGDGTRELRAADIVWLMTSGEPPVVQIVAPGGRGKSALLMRIAELSIRQFLETAKGPVPVFIDAFTTLDKGVVDRVRKAFGRFEISAAQSIADLAEGRLLVLIDGLNELGITASQMRDFLESEEGLRTPMCMACRPNREMDQRIAISAPRLVRVEPRRLNDESAGEFLSWCLATSKRTGEAPAREAMLQGLRSLRSADQSYLPLLVKLYAQLHPERPLSFQDVFELTIERLLRNHEGADSLAMSALADTLAFDSYWNNETRLVAVEPGSADAASADRLAQDGLLVPDKSGHARYRFFHDSVQAYLAARKLARSMSPEDIIRAGGAPFFAKSGSDALGAVRSELFVMMVLVARHRRELRNTLAFILTRWATELGAKLSVDQVHHACAEGIRAEMAEFRRANTSATENLLFACGRSEHLDGDDDCAATAVLFSAIASLLWEHPEARKVPSQKEDGSAEPQAGAGG
jgi:hypothetical protein